MNKDERMDRRFDVGITGYWYATNYGSVLTYYSLYEAIRKLGFSAVLIDRPEKEKDPEGEDVFPRRFLNKHCNISESVKWDQIKELSNLCETFIIGSDQVWTKDSIRYFGYTFFLDFANEKNRKIAYAPSFGNNKFDISYDEYLIVTELLQKFNCISVREDVGKKILNEQFGCKAEHVLDPVFLVENAMYDNVAEKSNADTATQYILAYILDPNIDKEKSLKRIAETLNLPVKIILDGRKGTFEHNKRKFELFTDNEIIPEVSVEDWVKYFKDAAYVFTDSHHGLAMGIIYRKNFICYANHHRGYARFTSLLGLLGLKERMIEKSESLTTQQILNQVEYNTAYEKLDKGKKFSIKWLEDALKMPIEKKIELLPITHPIESNDQTIERDNLLRNPDFIKIRILATLLRDYGIKHIILSPGGRDVPLVRMFEYNEDQFILHNVTDERSAAYFGLGIAAQLRQPVACICTSGTAASNYLPAVTEAYYTGIPLIVVTADRREIYLNHGEDQTIPQKHIYDGVVKKSVSLSEGEGYLAEYQTRRDISDCILESTHNGFGPVHINISIDNISIGANVSREHWALLPYIYPHILRVSFVDGMKDMFRWVEALKKSTRILVVYGQTPPLSENQKRYVEMFVEKYNCVIVTDHISNLDCKYSLKPYNMLQSILQDEFNNDLSPDILITVGGKRLMNDPLTYKVRGGPGNIRHWSVVPDGKIRDFYFRLSSVIEASQDNFFEWFSNNAGDIKNDGEFYLKWKQKTDKFASPVINRFNANYIQSKFLPMLPKNSMLHLGVGQSFFDCRRYDIDPTVEVHCNMGTNGIDGCTSTFMGQCSVVKDRLCFLLVGDLSFFYDMNAIWNKSLRSNVRILLVNNNGTGLLRGHNLKAVSSVHNTAAEGWVKSTGFEYISAHNKEEFEEKLHHFISNEPQKALFFEVFCE